MRSRAGGGALGVFERVRGPSGTPGHASEEAARKSAVYARRKLALTGAQSLSSELGLCTSWETQEGVAGALLEN